MASTSKVMVCLWNTLHVVSLCFILFFLLDVKDAEAKAGMDGAYAMRLAGQGEIFFSRIPDVSKEMKTDIVQVYPIGRAGFAHFNGSTLVLTSDNIAALQLLLPRPHGTEQLTLSGTWGVHGGANRVHLSGTGLYGLHVTVDGLLHPALNGYRMNGILTIAVQEARHVEKVTLNLTRTSPPQSTGWVATSIDGARELRELQKIEGKGSAAVLSEPSKVIGGVPTPLDFAATITATVDGVELAPMKGRLLLDEDAGSREPALNLTLATQGEMGHGWSSWVTAEQPGTAVRAENGRIKVAIVPSAAFRNLVWYVGSIEHPENSVPVLVQDGEMHFEVTAERFSGTINAEGVVLEGKKQSTFSAKVHGERQGGRMIKHLASYFGARPFAGSWHDSRLGDLTLNQQGDKVQGTLAAVGRIDGVVTGSILDFSWINATGRSGRGFLSTSGKGLLLGMIWTGEDRAAAKEVIATQVAPAVGEFEQVVGLMDPANDAQANELKYLGYDLSSAGKHQEAAALLLKVVVYFREQAQRAANNPGAHSNYVISQVIPLYTLLNSAFEAGDYPVLLEALGMTIDVQQEMGSGRADRRALLEQAGKYLAAQEKNTETLEKLQEAFGRATVFLTASGIGIALKDAQDDAGRVVVEGVASGMPAELAGVAVGDIVESIDGVSVSGIDADQVSQRLRGEAGRPVSLGLLRGGKNLQLSLVRVPYHDLPAGRRDALIEDLTAIQKLLARSANHYSTEADAVKQLTDAGKLPLKWDDLVSKVAGREGTVREDVLAATILAKRSLVGSSTASDLFEEFSKIQADFLSTGKMSEEASARLLKLDQAAEEFEQSAGHSDLDKELLRLSILMIGSLNNMLVETRGRLRMVQAAAKASSELPVPAKTAEAVTALSKWLDNWRARMATDAAKIFSLRHGQDFYQKYVRVLFALKLPEQALVASESARARAFADLMATSAETRTVLSRILKSEGLLLNPVVAQPLSLEALRGVARAQGGTVVEYFLLDDAIAAWTIAPDGKVLGLLEPVQVQEINEAVGRLANLFGEGEFAGQHGAENRAEGARLLRKLHEKLIEPLIRENLLGPSKGRLTIIPHGSLFRVPFAALQDRDGRYLVEDHELTYGTALSILKHAQERAGERPLPAKERHLLALVSPEPLPNSEQGSKKPLPPLPKSAELFPRIADFYLPAQNRQIIYGADASDSVLRERAAKADVIYFATHAEVNQEKPLDSFIALAKSKSSDGLFRVRDVYGLNLKAELAILAACETGWGNVSGDGIDGLSRAFTLAGSRALLLSLWSVAETQTSILMYQFHDFWLNEAMAKAAALRNAQLRMIEERRYREQPNLWAGFVLYGEPH